MCSSASSSVLNVKIDDGSKLAYVFTRSLLQAFDSLLFLFCCFLVTSWLHSHALSRPETSCLLSVLNLHTLANTVCLSYLRLTCIPSSSKEKLLFVSSNTWNLIISNGCWHFRSIDFTNCYPGTCNTVGGSSPLFALSALSMSLLSDT